MFVLRSISVCINVVTEQTATLSVQVSALSFPFLLYSVMLIGTRCLASFSQATKSKKWIIFFVQSHKYSRYQLLRISRSELLPFRKLFKDYICLTFFLLFSFRFSLIHY